MLVNRIITLSVVGGIIIATILANVLICGVVKHAAWCQWWPDLTLVKMVELIKSSGGWGIGISIGIMMIHSFIPFPAEFVAIANGMVYGIFWGTVITWIGAMFGAFLAFGLARVMGRTFVYRMITLEHARKVDGWVERYGGQMIFVSRLIPIIAFNAINYAAGLTRVSWWTFTWTTGTGILPMTVLMVVLGNEAPALTQTIWVILAIVAVILATLAHRLQKNIGKRLS